MNTSLLSPVWTHLTKVNVVRGEGIYLFDEVGDRYTDFTSGIGVTSTGHCHPQVVEAIQDQAGKLLFGQMNCVIPAVASELATRLNEITPSHIDSFFFSNSGAEATEAAVKLAKAATGRANIIVFQGGFHGRTHLAMAMTTSRTIYRSGFQPLPAGIFVAPFPYSFYYGWDEATTVEFCIRQLDLLFQGQTAPSETAAIIIEPVLGEGGYVPAPPAFLKHLKRVCNEHGIMLIMDEVQSGFGRTGKMFCFEYASVVPDIIVMAKGLGSGLPISAIASSRAIMEKWKPGSHGGTYGGGSAIPMAAAIATIDVIGKEHLVQNAMARGIQLRTGLRELQSKFPMLGDVRGLGLMTAVELMRNGEPDPALTEQILNSCISKKLMLLSCGSFRNVIRWIPPLVVSEEQINDALAIFATALQETTG
jgi:4-aminobutyrate aminotransferase